MLGFAFGDLIKDGFIAHKSGDFIKANEFYKKSCDGGYAGGCSNLGVLYANGQGVRQDKSIAKEYFSKACDLGYQDGCNEQKRLNKEGF